MEFHPVFVLKCDRPQVIVVQWYIGIGNVNAMLEHPHKNVRWVGGFFVVEGVLLDTTGGKLEATVVFVILEGPVGPKTVDAKGFVVLPLTVHPKQLAITPEGRLVPLAPLREVVPRLPRTMFTGIFVPHHYLVGAKQVVPSGIRPHCNGNLLSVEQIIRVVWNFYTKLPHGEGKVGRIEP
jgi:hypothetical protein